MEAADIERFLDLAADRKRFVLTTHVAPDGDGIGSQLGLRSLIEQFGGSVRIVNHDPTPEGLAFLDPEGCCEVYDPARHDEVIAGTDVLVMMDNSVPSRLSRMLEPVRRTGALRACIDHHPDPDPFWTLLLVDDGASCTAELVWRLFAWRGVEIDATTADRLYAALVSDTGRFRFANANEGAFRMAAELVAAGADPARICGELEERQSDGFLRLYGEILSTMETRADGRLVILRAPREMIERHGMADEDFAEIINSSLRKRGSRLAALFREVDGGEIKVSLRSKGERNVNRLARAHGGGGHRNASGIVIDAELENAVQRLLPELENLARD
jgi:phosphoesterase RecJ-like protein